MIIEESTPIAALSVSEFRHLMKEVIKPEAKEDPSPDKKYVYGLKGIQDIFKCSHVTAQKYKDGILRPACMQSGRKIVIDVDLAIKLFKESERRLYGRR